jgi:Ribonuclease T2 family
LQRAGIIPSNTTTYTLTQLQSALQAQTGAIPYLGCGGNGTILEEVWYFNHVQGTVCLEERIIIVFFADGDLGTIWPLQAVGFDHCIDLLNDCAYLLLRAHSYI